MRTERAPLLPVFLDAALAQPLHRQLYAQIRDAILAGRLAPGSLLPSSRGFARELRVGRNTVLAAFDQLAAEGYLEGRAGSGVFVSPVLPPDAMTSASPRAKASTPPSLGRPAGSTRGQSLAAAAPPRDGAGAFAPGVPDCSSFPFDLWSRLLAKSWHHPPGSLYAAADPAGYPPLRAAIADYLRTARGVACAAEQVIVVSGIRQALDLTARALLDPGDTVAIEEPGFPGIRAALLGAGAAVHPVPVDGEGMLRPDSVSGAKIARLACVAPSHQYPLGIAMSLARRLELLAWARAGDAWILEDDWDSEYRYAGRPLPAMQGLDADGRVIYVGTLSKVLFPSLRIGYLVAPEALTDLFLRVRRALDDHPSTVAQPALAEFFASGQFAAHVRRMRKCYAARQRVLVAAAAEQLSGLLDVAPDEAGMHLVADLAPAVAERMSDKCAAEAAARAGIVTTPLSRYYLGPPGRAGLLLGYAAVPEVEIDPAIVRLARALRSARSARPRPPAGASMPR